MHRHEREGILLLLAVCASAAVLLTQLKAAPGPMTGAIVAAVEFFPSPITATLLAFLGRFSSGFALREDLGDYDLLNPSSAARRKQVLLEEGWPRGELPSKVGLREHMQARAALHVRWAGLPWQCR